jgi:hypothetical protein
VDAGDGVVEGVLTFRNGLMLAKGPFGVLGRLLLRGAGELDRLNSLRGAGDAVPDLLDGRSNTLFRVDTIGSVAAFSSGFGPEA